MTVVDRGSTKIRLVTTKCALCGGVRGDDYETFSYHLSREHTIDDLALTSTTDSPDSRHVGGGLVV